MNDVRPLDHDRVETRHPKPPPEPVRSRDDERRVVSEMIDGEFDPAVLETGDDLIYKAPGLQDRQFRRLRRGQIALEGELDLHGMSADTAREAVAAFLDHARAGGRRCVRIIHGKGLGSRGGRPVLKTGLPRWLRQRRDVLGYCSARPVDGGTGAVYVLIRKGS
jgi:DNA-nicking Smr family endonuclease